MPDLAPRYGGPCLDYVSVPASSRGVYLPGDASAHTKTGWVELHAGLTAPCALLVVNLRAISGRILLDVGIGASTAETVLAANLYVDSDGGADGAENRVYYLPVAIPPGTRISARHQANGAFDDCYIGVQCFAPTLDGRPPLARVETCGALDSGATALTTIDPGGTANTKGSWVELIAATSFPYRWLVFTPSFGFDATGNTIRALVDIGVGAAGSEVVVLPDLFIRMSGATDTYQPTMSLPVNIPAGSRIAARAQSQSNTANERLIEVAVYGVG